MAAPRVLVLSFAPGTNCGRRKPPRIRTFAGRHLPIRSVDGCYREPRRCTERYQSSCGLPGGFKLWRRHRRRANSRTRMKHHLDDIDPSFSSTAAQTSCWAFANGMQVLIAVGRADRRRAIAATDPRAGGPTPSDNRDEKRPPEHEDTAGHTERWNNHAVEDRWVSLGRFRSKPLRVLERHRANVPRWLTAARKFCAAR